MAWLYFDLIKKNLWKLENVPLVWREQVRQMLEADENAQ
ncbi:CD1375 family protein [Ureibacillus sp. FSL W8-0352]